MPELKKKKYYNKWHYYRLYRIWTNMKARCYNKNTINYHRYGGRGIKVCDEWMNFKNFERDMLPSYKNGLTIERINNYGNYNKENCEWSSYKEQAQNTRTIGKAIHITFNGETKTITEWAKYLGINRRTLGMRICNYNWPVVKAFTRR